MPAPPVMALWAWDGVETGRDKGEDVDHSAELLAGRTRRFNEWDLGWHRIEGTVF